MSDLIINIVRDSTRECDLSCEQKKTELEIIIKNKNDQIATDNRLIVYIVLNFCIVILNIFLIFHPPLLINAAGIFYIVFSCIGNLLTITNNIFLILFLVGKVTITTSEIANRFLRTDFIFYLVTILGFFIWKWCQHELVLVNHALDYTILLIILINSFINYVAIKMNISQRIRIKSRGLSEYKKKLLS